MELKGNQQIQKNQHAKYRGNVFIPKQDPAMPDLFSVTFELRNGEKRSFECIGYHFIPDSKCFEVHTVEDEFKLIPADVVTEVSLDKRFSKILELSQKEENQR